MNDYALDDPHAEAAAARRAPPTRRHLPPEENEKLTLIKIWLEPHLMKTLRTLANRSGHANAKAAKHLLKNSMSFAMKQARDSAGVHSFSRVTEVAPTSK